jgi:hypothetical protein
VATQALARLLALLGFAGLVLAGEPRAAPPGSVIVKEGKGIPIEVVETAAEGASCTATGEQHVAVLLVEYPGAPLPRQVTPGFLRPMFFAGQGLSLYTYWREASYGKTWPKGDVFGPFVLDKPYECGKLEEVLAAAVAAARSSVDFKNFDRLALVLPPTEGCLLRGISTIGCRTIEAPEQGKFVASVAWLVPTAQDTADVLGSLVAHEMGHGLGLHHSSTLDFDKTVLGESGQGKFVDAGDPNSTIGASGFARWGHYSVQHKARLEWLPAEAVRGVEEPGRYRLAATEEPSEEPRALRVRRPGLENSWLWLEYRRPRGFHALFGDTQAATLPGALVYLDEPGLPDGHTVLLHLQPVEVPNDFAGAALRPGQVWKDPGSRLRLLLEIEEDGAAAVTVAHSPGCAVPAKSLEEFGPAEQAGSTDITGEADCKWQARSQASWISLETPGEVNGTASLKFKLASNKGSRERAANITIGAQAVLIRQAGSEPQTPQLVGMTPAAGTGFSEVFEAEFEDLNGAADLTLVRLDFRNDVNFTWCSVEASLVARSFTLLDNEARARLGPLAAGSEAVRTIPYCSLRAAASSMGLDGDRLKVKFAMDFWPAFAGSLSLLAQATDAAGRTSSVGAGSGRWLVPGGTCTYQLFPTNVTLGNAASEGAFSLRVLSAPAAGCRWSAESDSPWLTLVSGAAGDRDATIRYRAAALPQGEPARRGAIRAGGQPFLVAQSPAACTVTVSASAVQAPAGGASGHLDVTTSRPDCAWSVSSDSEWLRVAGPAARTGADNVGWVVSANPAASYRTAYLTIGGRVVFVVQLAPPR